MGKGEELILRKKYEKATGGDLNIIEGVHQQINGKVVLALKIEKTAVNLCDRKALEQDLEKYGLHLHESSQYESPFMYVCDGTEIGGA